MIGDNIRRKPREMTDSAEALKDYFLHHPLLKDEGDCVVSLEIEANAEAVILDVPVDHFLEDTKLLFNKGVILDTKFNQDGERLFYKHYLVNPECKEMNDEYLAQFDELIEGVEVND